MTAFAVWITGLPASGKSTITRALVRELAARRIDVEVLESDSLRHMITPYPTYRDEERDMFYRAMVQIGTLLVAHGISVVFDATANRRAYRTAARSGIEHFVEVLVDCPLEVCIARDPKGIYRKAQSGEAATVPGLQASYELPERPDVVVSGSGDTTEAALAIVRTLEARGYLADSGVQAIR
ncbi:MAG TPA: adenylyl-sulfate kinase [Vicinamibacterales bacterium]|jgi:adenylylsulfate kinase